MKVNKLLNTKFKNNHIISKITNNSKECMKDCIFIVNDKNINYLSEALNLGASTIIAEKEVKVDPKINFLVVDNIKLYQAELLKIYYHKQLSQYKIIGVTGTNGKTSSSTYIYKYLRYINEDALLISSLGFYLDDLVFDTNNTTPSIFKIYEFLDKNLKKNKFKKTKNNIHYLILECSSQGIRDLRIKYIPFDVIVFTNITSDHLDFHKNYSDYFYSKCLLLNQLKENGIVISNTINCDSNLIKEISNNRVYTFGKNSDYNFNIISSTMTNTLFEINNNLFKTSVSGDYQIENLTASFVALSKLKIDMSYFRTFLYQLEPLPGRFNLYKIKNKNIIIDYGHTYNAFIKTIEFIKKNINSKLWVVCGCGGNRDKTKRPLIGQYVTANSNFVVFTEDNNRNEQFEDIVNDIIANVEQDNFIIIKDRYEAISYALNNSTKDDYIAIIGKGLEKTLVDYNYLTDLEIVKVLLND